MKSLVALFVLALIGTTVVIGISVHEGQQKTLSEDPTVWEETIAAFEAADQDNPPPENAILFTGSSSIRLWHSLEEDMAPLVVIERGFGGSRALDLAFFTERLVLPYQPRAVVIFIGANDLLVREEAAKAITDIAEGVGSTLATIRASLPEVDVFYIEITPAIALGGHSEAVKAANQAVQALLQEDPHAHFIHTADMFLDESGAPEKKLFQYDGLHLSEEGYALWTARIKPLLEAL